MAEPFLGQILMVGFNFAPRGWAYCNGQLLPIAQNTALFSLLGTTYGGNGQTTFALPNLQSRVPIHFGQGAGLSAYSLGETGGQESVTLTTPQMPAHNHTAALNASGGAGSDGSPTGNYLADGNQYTSSTNTSMNANAVAIGIAGGTQPHSNIQPYLGLNFIIALEGIFPSRN